jgi:hypothetical protein
VPPPGGLGSEIRPDAIDGPAVALIDTDEAGRPVVAPELEEA